MVKTATNPEVQRVGNVGQRLDCRRAGSEGCVLGCGSCGSFLCHITYMALMLGPSCEEKETLDPMSTIKTTVYLNAADYRRLK